MLQPQPDSCPQSQQESSHFIEEVDVGAALELAQGLVALQGATVQLLVGRDDVHAPLHPLQVVSRGLIAGSGIDDDSVWHIVAG